jgi:hypothetical protein
MLEGLAVAFLLVAFPLPASVQHAGSGLPQAPETVVACRVLEAHASPQLRLTLVVFHHQDEKDRGRLGSLLRQYSGSSIEFETPSGTRHSATVLRLKSCFGRGLLLFPASAAQLKEKDTFLLRLPSDGAK